MKITCNDVVWRAHVCAAQKKKRVIGYLYVIICWYMHLYVTRVLPLVVMFSSFFFFIFYSALCPTLHDWPITHSLWFQKVLLAFNKCQRKEETVFISRRVFIWDRHKTLIIPMAQCTDKRLTLWFCAEKVALLIDRRLTSSPTFFLFFSSHYVYVIKWLRVKLENNFTRILSKIK